MIGRDSPLLARTDIDDRQAAYLDAVAFTANVIDAVYRRLRSTLLAFPTADDPSPAIEVAFADALGLVDWVHRLDGLVERCRGLPRDSTARATLRYTTSLVENIRHAVQHLEGTVPLVEMSGRPVWGHLCWVIDRGPTYPGHTRGVYYCIIPGYRKGPGPEEFRPPSILVPRAEIDHITLFSADGQAEIGLTGQHEAVARFMPQLEAAVRAAGAPPSPGEVLRIPLP